jgi:hypothetical protein
LKIDQIIDTGKIEKNILAIVSLPDASKPIWDGKDCGGAMDGMRAARSFLGFNMRVVKSALQKAVRNGEWRLAAIMISEALGNLKLFEKNGQPSKSGKAISTNIVNRLLTIAVEDCAASPGLVNLVLEKLVTMSKSKLQYQENTFQEILRIAVALCDCPHFRPSTLLHAYASSNSEIIKRLNIDLGPKLSDKTFEDLVREKSLYAFGMLADNHSSDTFVERFWKLLSNKYPVVYQAYKLRAKAFDRRAFLQYALMVELLGDKIGNSHRITNLILPNEYQQTENQIMEWLKEKRYSVIIPADSIIHDLHTTRRTAEGAEFFRRHAAVVNCPEALKQLQDKFLPVYYESQFK